MNKNILISPTKALILFVLIVLIYFSINYLSLNSGIENLYSYKKIARLFNFFCFLPSTIFILVISLMNLIFYLRLGEKKFIIISLIPLVLILLFYLFIFIKLLHGAMLVHQIQ